MVRAWGRHRRPPTPWRLAVAPPAAERWDPVALSAWTGYTFDVLLLAAILACAPPVIQTGAASWYGRELAGRPTASGEPFRPGLRTAAHPTLPFGTVLRVTRTDTGRSVRVVVNDRGPYAKGRIIDLAQRAARRLDMIDLGVATVELRVVGCRAKYGKCSK
jgi:rare lipoprotein A